MSVDLFSALLCCLRGSGLFRRAASWGSCDEAMRGQSAAAGGGPTTDMRQAGDTSGFSLQALSTSLRAQHTQPLQRVPSYADRLTEVSALTICTALCEL